MKQIYLLEGKLGIKTTYAELWSRTLIGPTGRSTMLSPHEEIICRVLMLGVGVTLKLLLEHVYPHPDYEPAQPETTLKVKIHFLNRKRLAGIGLIIQHPDGRYYQQLRVLKPMPTPGHH